MSVEFCCASGSDGETYFCIAFICEAKGSSADWFGQCAAKMS